MNEKSEDGVRTLLPVERRERLLRTLEDGATHRVDDLAEHLGVTAVTVRRDLALLADQSRVRRVRGGVRGLAGAPAPTPSTGSGEAPRRFVLGMIVPSLRYYWPEVVRGARAAADESGAAIALRGSTYDLPEYRREVSALLEAADLDGLIVAPDLRAVDPDLGSWLTSLGVPVVLAERNLTTGPHLEPMESVATDHALGAALAVRRLAALGHRRVGLMTADTVTSRQVRSGWRHACEELDLPLDGTPDISTRFYADPSWRPMAEDAIRAAKASETTALLVHPDAEAIAFVDLCAQQRLRIPDDLSVIAYDDEVAGCATPPLTAIRPPKEAIGRYAVETLLSRLAPGGAYLPRRRIILNPVLVERESTAPRRASANGQPAPAGRWRT